MRHTAHEGPRELAAHLQRLRAARAAELAAHSQSLQTDNIHIMMTGLAAMRQGLHNGVAAIFGRGSERWQRSRILIRPSSSPLCHRCNMAVHQDEQAAAAAGLLHLAT